jgi:hypothetical protein
MAAWVARVEGVSSDGTRVNVDVGFYDATDATFNAQLFGRSYIITPDVTLATINQQIVNDGQAARAIFSKRDSLLPRVGQTIQVP